jgi:hypothetical protein
MRFWTYVETREIDQFSVILDWCYEEVPIREMFDETCYDIEDMERRHDAGIDTHYIARVRALYKGREMGSATLGSCYAHECDPADDMVNGICGYLDDMIAEALDEARTACVDMLEVLKKDFLGVDAETA